jgi:cyanate lyase
MILDMHALLKWKLKKKLSFADIGKATGFTRTKVHRQLTGETDITAKEAAIYSDATGGEVSLEAICGLKPKRGSAHACKS